MQTTQKQTIDFGFSPSEYQKKIFDFVQHDIGNAVIKACAGSGKTHTLLICMELIPKTKNCLFIAFNKSIVDELTNKIGRRNNCTIRTIHSLGYLMLQRNSETNIDIDEYKYRTYLKNNIHTLTSINEDVKLTQHQVDDYIENITKLIDFSRFNLAQCTREIKKVAATYDIPVSFDECEVVLQCMEWGKTHTNTVDYIDMVWLPYELSLKPVGLQYDWIFIDEAQDMSVMAIELFKKCFKRGTRFIAAGDDQQSIYLFAGSSVDAFNDLLNFPHTKKFTLPITYRCSKRVTAFANGIVPEIEAAENAEEGEVIDNCPITMIKQGDMVLARSKTPLVQLYVKLLRYHVKCYIKGSDIGENLISLINQVDTDVLGTNLQEDGLFVRLYEKLFDERNLLMEKHSLGINEATITTNILDLYDKISALSILAEYCMNKQDLIKNIENIFVDDAEGVCLSTIHKAKGLENKNVYILCHSTMPSKKTKHEWEQIQEKNLQYVAYTRAKTRLGFISENEIRPSRGLVESSVILRDLANIERIIAPIIGIQPKSSETNINFTKFKLRGATDVSQKPTETLDNTQKSDAEYLKQALSDLFN